MICLTFRLTDKWANHGLYLGYERKEIWGKQFSGDHLKSGPLQVYISILYVNQHAPCLTKVLRYGVASFTPKAGRKMGAAYKYL